jgi:lycopene beta-cyclase
MSKDFADSTYDYILVGGGLQNGLVALALGQHQPDARVLMIEQHQTLGGNHTWSFHPGDLTADSSTWINPLVGSRWTRYGINVGGRSQELDLSYSTIPSNRLADALTQLANEPRSAGSTNDLQTSNNFTPATNHFDTLESAATTTLKQAEADEDARVGGLELRLGTKVSVSTATYVVTDDDEQIRGQVVIDSRGPSPKPIFRQCGYQKFWGFEIATPTDWPLSFPTIMDDRVDQSDGFRFMYTLPMDRRRILVEDTRFSDTPELVREECLTIVTQFLKDRGVEDWSIIREEHGVLPMPISSERLPGRTDTSDGPIHGGYAGGWFHAATGYSFPLAVAFADVVAKSSPKNIRVELQRLANSHQKNNTFARFLNRLLFRLVKPSKRYQIFRRFYKVLDGDSIIRFYSHRFTARDAFRIVVGMPPSGLQPLRFARSFISNSSEAS